MPIRVFTNEDISLALTLTDEGETFDIDSGATITAMFRQNDVSISGTVTVLESAVGSDWNNSLIIVEFTDVEAGNITATGEANLEVLVDDTVKSTFLTPVTIRTGLL